MDFLDGATGASYPPGGAAIHNHPLFSGFPADSSGGLNAVGAMPMPDLVPVEPSSEEIFVRPSASEAFVVNDGAEVGAATGAEGAPILRVNSTANFSAERSVTPEPKKKIQVDALSKEELVQQCKKQMILLQKTKSRYDELQKSYNELQQQHEHPNGIAEPDHESFQTRINAVELELKREREQHRKTKEQVARLSQHSIAELEIRDYTRTIAQLNEKLAAKDDCLLRTNEKLQLLESESVAKDAVKSEQSAKIEEFAIKCTNLEQALTDSRKTSLDKEREIAMVREELSAMKARVVEVEQTLANNNSNQSDLVRNFSKLQETLEVKERTIMQKTAEVVRVNVDLNHARSQQEHLVRDFEEYKMRAQTLLKQQKTSSDHHQRQRDLDDMTERLTEQESEITELRRRNMGLENELQVERRALDEGKGLLDAERIRWESSLMECEDRIRTLERVQESAYQDHRKKVKQYETDISSLKDLHATTSEKLLDEIRSLRVVNDSLRHQISAIENSAKNHSIVDDVSFLRSKSEEFYDSRPLDAVSSDSSQISELPSFNRTVSVSASELVSVPPLEKLITYPQNEIMITAKDVDVRKMKHLSELLQESESTNVRLGEQIKVLKHELRRMESNVEREKHADSMEYLKNVLMKFLTHKVATSEQEKLIEVMTTILKLTVEERQQLMKAASVSYIPENVRAWGTYFNPWKGKDG